MEVCLFYRSWFDALEGFSKSEREEAVYALVHYAFTGEVLDTLSPIVKVILTMAQPIIDTNAKKKEGSRKGGRPEKTKPMVSENEKPMVLEKTKPMVSENEKPMVLEKTKPMVSENEKPIKYCEPARYELRGEDVAGLNWKRMQSNLEANAEQPGSKYPANAEQNQSDADADVEQMQYNQYPLNEKEKYTKEKEKRDLIINNNLYEIDKIDRGSMRGKGREEREKGERLLATLEESVRAFGLSTTRLSGDSRCTAMTDAGVQCTKNAAIRIDGKDYCLQHAQRDFAMMCKVSHYDFVPKDWWMVVYTWLNYKRERKESYKSTQSIKVFYNNLFKLSGGNPQTAKSIIEQSMANNWAGIFGLKTSIYGRSSPPAKPNPRFQVGNFENEESTI